MRGSVGEVAGGPSVVGGGGLLRIISDDFEEGVFGRLVAEVVGTHIGGEEGSAIEGRNEVEADGVAKAMRDDAGVFAIGIHDRKGGADLFFLLTGIAG